MTHRYRNGREAKVGDHVVGSVGGRAVAGTLSSLIEPNGLVTVGVLEPGAGGALWRDTVLGHASDFWHAEDAAWVNAAGDACRPPVLP